MKRITKRTVLGLVLALVLCFSTVGAFSEETEEARYKINEWNYVDQSLDISRGIPEDAEGVLDRVRRTGVLRVATEPYFAPQEFIDPDLQGQEQYVGSDMKLARLIAERMGVRLEIIPMDFTDVLPALTEDLCDLTISAIAFMPSRASAYTLSKGYYFTDSAASSAVVIREEDAGELTDLESLGDRIIAAQRGSLQEAQAVRNIPGYQEFRRVSTVEDVYAALRSGQADAAVLDMETAENYIANNPDAKLTLIDGIYFQQEEYELGDRICAKQGELQLICFVNAVIDEVVADGSYSQWFEEAEKRAAELGL